MPQQPLAQDVPVAAFPPNNLPGIPNPPGWPVVYDMRTDEDRLVTQDDVDRMQRTQRAFGELVKQMRFHLAEVRNGLIKPGVGIDAIASALQLAEQVAASWDLAAMEQAGVHGRQVLVVER